MDLTHFLSRTEGILSICLIGIETVGQLWVVACSNRWLFLAETLSINSSISCLYGEDFPFYIYIYIYKKEKDICTQKLLLFTLGGERKECFSFTNISFFFSMVLDLTKVSKYPDRFFSLQGVKQKYYVKVAV